MIGSQSDPGIMVRVMEDLFTYSKRQGKQQGVQFKVTVSFLEVYNENIRDLLSDVEEYLDLREDPIKGPVVASITEIEATSGQEIMQLLHQGNAKRSQAATAANEVSSRSHAVLQVVVECRDRAPGTVANIKVGKLSLVDLAGSERAANTKNSGQRLVEGANINRSLLALGNCINALGEKGNKGNFVPYRDSKLTRLLKDSLGGNCRTVMIANISSAESSFEETLNTLKYANRAKNIKTNVQRNVLNVNYHISEYVELITNLRNEIQVLKSQISNGSDREGLGSAGGLGNGLLPPTAIPPGEHPSSPNIRGASRHSNHKEPSTPFQALRESLRSATHGGGLGGGQGGEGREFVNNMRQKIVDNFQERMQLRRSLIELEDQNVQNSIEVSKRQLMVVQWSEKHGKHFFNQKLDETLENADKNGGDVTKADFTGFILSHGSPDIIEAWQECEQLRKAIIKNNGMKKNIGKRLRYNEKEAEKFREELSNNITGEDRRELMALQYQVGRLELENMELEQHRIVHESILKGKDLIIQKLKLQLAVRDKVINRQQLILREHGLDHKVGYEQLQFMEDSIMSTTTSNIPNEGGGYIHHPNHNMHLLTMTPYAPPSPPRNMQDLLGENKNGQGRRNHGRHGGESKFSDDEYSEDEEHHRNHHKGGVGGGSGIDKSNTATSIESSVTVVSPSKVMVPKLKIKEKPSLASLNHAVIASSVNGGGGGNAGRNANGPTSGSVVNANNRRAPPVSKGNNANKVLSSSHISEGDGEQEDEQDNEDIIDDVEDQQDEFDEDVAFTERGEVALTSRDRDMIEQGDWSEIQSELSDHDFSYQPTNVNGKKIAGNKKKVLGNKAASKAGGGGVGGSNKSNVQGTPASSAKQPSSSAMVTPMNNNINNGGLQLSNITPQSGVKSDSKGVHGPRGGRIYRSSEDNNMRPNNGGSNSNNPNGGNAGGGKGVAGNNRLVGFQEENNSDEDSISSNQQQKFMQAKYRHYNSPRGNGNNKDPNGGGQGSKDRDSNFGGRNNNGSLDKLDPINGNKQDYQNVGEGILSGRKYDKDSHYSMAPYSNDISPRANGNGNDNFAIIYPANGGPPGNGKQGGKGEKGQGGAGAMRGENLDFSPIVSSIRNNISKMQEERNNKANANINAANKAAIAAVAPLIEDENFEIADPNDLVIKSKALGKPLGKVKAAGAGKGMVSNESLLGGKQPGSNVASAADIPTANNMNNDNVASDLNIMGNGYEGLGAVPKPNVLRSKPINTR